MTAKIFIILAKRLVRIRHSLSDVLAWCAGESTFEVKIEADGNVVTEHPHYDQPSIGMFGFSDALFSETIFRLFQNSFLLVVDYNIILFFLCSL